MVQRQMEKDNVAAYANALAVLGCSLKSLLIAVVTMHEMLSPCTATPIGAPHSQACFVRFLWQLEHLGSYANISGLTP